MHRGHNRENIPNYYRDVLNPLFFLQDKRPLIQFLMDHHVLKANHLCQCGRQASLIKRRSVADGYIWYCNGCRKEKSIRNNSIFQKFSRVPMGNLLFYIWQWCLKPPTRRDNESYGIASHRVVLAIKNELCNICADVMDEDPIPMIGGAGVIVEVDESVFRKRKYHRGRLVVTRWVVGLVSLQHNPPQPIFLVVERRDRGTLHAIIQRHVLPGSTVRTDCWRGYDGLGQIGYIHETVNHSRNFVNPINGCHTNNIENAWQWAKVFIKQHTRVSDDAKLHLYLQCYMWRQWRGRRNARGVFHQLLEDIGRIYDI